MLNKFIIQNHELQDIYRIKDGLILEINKYKCVMHCWRVKDIKKKKLKGISKTYEIIENFNDPYGEYVIEKGSILKDCNIIKKVDPSQYTAELKSSGGSVYGSIEDHLKLYEEIQNILNSYK